MNRFDIDGNAWGYSRSSSGEWVMYEDVAGLERRYHEAVEIISDFDAYTRGETFRADCERMAAFLAEEEK